MSETAEKVFEATRLRDRVALVNHWGAPASSQRARVDITEMR